MRQFFAYCFFLLSILFFSFGGYLLWQRNNPGRIAFRLTQSLPGAENSSAVRPLTISIPSANITLPIYPARIVNNRWEDTKDGVSYLASSPLPGARGNSILYGHNWTTLLGNLTKVKPGDTITIAFTSGTTKQFIVKFVSVVTPDETHILDQTNDERLTLYTCTGFLDSKRLVVTAIIRRI